MTMFKKGDIVVSVHSTDVEPTLYKVIKPNWDGTIIIKRISKLSFYRRSYDIKVSYYDLRYARLEELI